MKKLYKITFILSLFLLLGQSSLFAETHTTINSQTAQACDAAGWCDVNIKTNTQIFDSNCEYRYNVQNIEQKHDEPALEQYRYAQLVFPTFLEGVSQTVINAYTHEFAGGAYPNSYIFYNDKAHAYYRQSASPSKTYAVIKMQKRCVINQTLKGQLSLFHLTLCPTGWKSVFSLAAPADYIYCEKE